MLREWVAFLDDFLRGHGTPAVAKAAVGIMSFAVLLGAVLGSTAIKSGALVATVLLFTAIGIALLADRRSDRRELENHRRLVWHYCKIKNDQDSAFHIIKWDDTLIIDERGDTREKVRMRLQPLRSDLWFISLVSGCGWPQPARFRRKVKVSVRHVLANGSPGTSLLTTSSWRRDGKMDVTIHLSEPPGRNTTLSVDINVMWPGRCAPLMDGNPEKFSLGFKQPVRHARYRVITPPGITTYSEPIKVNEPDDIRYLLTTATSDEGREQTTFEAFDLPPRRTVGVRLEIKEKLRRAVAVDGASAS